MATFYDESGSAVAYSDDDTHVYRFSGQPVAYFQGDSVYSFGGRHLGWYMDGWIYDPGGLPLFFSEDSKGGPLRPLRRSQPMKSPKTVMPMKAQRPTAPLPPMLGLGWSNLTAQDFFNE
jgi:hypothetical protein